MKLSYREKHAMSVVVVNVALFGYYFVAYIWSDSATLAPSALLMFMALVLASLLSQSVLRAVLNLLSPDRDGAADERDKLVALKGHRNGYIILVAGVWLGFLGCFLFSSTLLLAHFLMAFFLLAVVVEYATRLVLYRFGVFYE